MLDAQAINKLLHIPLFLAIVLPDHNTNDTHILIHLINTF